MKEVKTFQELDEDVEIEWWKENRQKINEVIREFNEWITILKERGFSGMHILKKN